MLIKPVIAKYQTFLQLKNMRSFVVKNYEDSETFNTRTTLLKNGRLETPL